jgi:hypothetical protein
MRGTMPVALRCLHSTQHDSCAHVTDSVRLRFAELYKLSYTGSYMPDTLRPSPHVL